MKPIKVGIIGLAHLHPMTYIPHFESCAHTKLTAIAEPNGELLNEKLAALGTPNAVAEYQDYKKLIDESGVDLVAIFSPHYECPGNR